ncbi:iron-siderophore ABC transporter substrate-binding protein [Gordonia sp. HY442]|uniref:iron-siderophore ABC transporter substrate-binding protein n=1 Tax=Gordonia zhenghanii TaxID=2911516 RepID=UPI001F2EA789|nr:iron-siderophore ABC transporter substrate-binding protein [Gordonia zhenghanii]MCF8607320.1 iron-siderophore ABC transporter substrate-binding protein [Gordonia zhenghanii]
MIRRGLVALATVATAAACITACSPAADAPHEDAAAGYPVTVGSTLGDVTVPTRPERVVTLGWGSTEAALALGVTPVGIRDMASDTTDGSGIQPWVADRLGDEKPELLDETSKSVPFEKIASLKPDVILAVQSGLTADQYALLSKIAPTVAYPGAPWQTSWRDQATTVGTVLGKPDEAKQLVADADARLAEVKRTHPEFAGKSIAATSVTDPASLGYYFDTDPRVEMLAAMGFTPLESLTSLRESAPDGKYAAQVGWEGVARYSPDVLTTWFLDASTKSGAESKPSYTSLRAVQQKSNVALTDPDLVFAASSPNVMNLPWLLDRIVPKLSKAADNVK